MNRKSTQTYLMASGLVASGAALAVVIAAIVLWRAPEEADPAGEVELAIQNRDDISRYLPFDGDKAYQHLVDVCEFGPRPSGSEGMRKQQQYIERHFTELGATVFYQRMERIRHPETGAAVPLANMIVRWHPEKKQRIVLCCHYDTRPYPDEDPVNPRGTFIGANDGASGVALLMELGRHMTDLKSSYGVDFVFFDAEEFIFDRRRDEYFLGSTHFAVTYRDNPPAFTYRWGVLVDMVADKDLQIYQERNSVAWRDTRPLVHEIWRTASRLGVHEFINRQRHTVNDDHVPLRNIGGIPTCDIIDFDYPNPRVGNTYWHTEQDIPENCSGLSLAKVGKVLLTWLEETP